MDDGGARREDFFVAVGFFALALAVRLLGLTAFLTADEPKAWVGRCIGFLRVLVAGDWAATFDSPAPGVTTMWAGAMGLAAEYLRRGQPGGGITPFLDALPFDPIEPSIMFSLRLPVVLVTAASAGLTYFWARRLFGRTAAAIAAGLLALDAFFVALSRVLGHDALVTAFMWLSLLALLAAVSMVPERRSRWAYLLGSGALGGLAFLTKYPSLYLGAFSAIVLLVSHVERGRTDLRGALLRFAVDLALWSAAAGAVFFLLWPSMWVHPVGSVAAIFEDATRAASSPHPKGSFFLGEPVPDPGAGFYLLVLLFRSSPLALAGLVIWGAWSARKGSVAQKQAAVVLLAYALLYGLMVTIGGKKQDRYILPAFPALIMLAAVGWRDALEWVRRAKFAAAAPFLPVSTAALLAVQGAFVLPYAPYYFTYYNPLAGGGRVAERAIIVGWGEGLDRAAAYLNSKPGIQDIEAVSWYSTTFEPYFDGQVIYKVGDREKLSRTPKPAVAADYVVLYVNQLQRRLPSDGALQYFRSAPLEHTVTLGGIEYAWVYPAPGAGFPIVEETRLVGQAELLAFDLLDSGGRRLDHASPGETVTLCIYWEWQGKAYEEPMRLEILDWAGKPRGEVEGLGTFAPVPFEEWQEGMVGRDDFRLALPADTPPGPYRLKVWIDRPATGETVGYFEFAPDDGVFDVR